MKIKLTKPQIKLLEDLSKDHESGVYIEILPTELRTAMSLEKKGLIKLHEDRSCACLIKTNSNTKTQEDLRNQFEKKFKIGWLNGQNEPEIEYVFWLERQILN